MTMMHLYRTVEDFVADESFQNYVLKQNITDVKKWEIFIRENPDKKTIIDESVFFIQLLTPQGGPVVGQQTNTRKKYFYLFGLLVCLATLAYIIYTLSLSANVSAAQTIISHSADENLTIALPDESLVELRAGSSISYVQEWDDTNERKVVLHGEAFFDVVKDQNGRSFVVEIADGNIEVLGTKFLAKSYEEHSMVFLEEGKVNCHVNGRNISIMPGDILQINGDQFAVEDKQEIRQYDTWRKEELSFKNMRIEDLIKTMNHSYDMDVQLGSSKLQNRKITATVDKNDPMLLLDAIAAIYDIEIIKESNKLILK